MRYISWAALDSWCIQEIVLISNTSGCWLKIIWIKMIVGNNLDKNDCRNLEIMPWTNPLRIEWCLVFGSGKASQKSQPGYGDIHPCSVTDLKSLRTLSLKSLKVTGDVLECFVRNCPFLERLVLHQCSSLVNFEVCGPSLTLKFLEICQCFTLKSITIRDTSLDWYV